MQFPLTRITIGFVFGILFANYFKFLSPTIGFVLLCFAFSLFTIAFYRSKKQFLPNNFFGITTYFLSFCIGVSTLLIHTGWHRKDNYIHHIKTSETQHTIEVVLREKLKSTTNYHRYIAHVKRIDGKSCTGKLMVNFNATSFENDFKIGTQLQINNNFILSNPPLNPDQFDYGKYLLQKSILAQTFVDHSNVKTNGSLVRDAFYYADFIRATILENLKKSNFNTTELNILMALLLGQQQDIAPEIVRDYQFAGAIHILSVSGLHVGFVLLFLNFLLQWIPNSKRNSYYKLAVTLFALWGFAFLAGLSPSVIRSVTMFSFVAVGLHLKRQSNIFHTLLVSLLLILLFEPSFLFDVGFQLSYVALFSILWMQPLFQAIWQPKNKITNYFWQILTVSFAAQIGTLPLSLYYFHQFSGLFFITNVVVIPFLSVIMALGIVVMLLASADFAPQFLAFALEWLIAILNKIIGSIASWEQFVLKDIPLNAMLLFSLYFLIVALVFCFKKASFQRIAIVLIAILLLQTSYFGSRWKAQQQEEWIVFNVKRATLIAARNGNAVTVFTNTELRKNNPLQSYLIANFCEIDTVKPIANLASFKNKKILIIDSLGNYPTAVNPDVMLLRDSPKINLDRVFKTCKPKALVADASNYKSYVALWKATCLKEKIPFHHTNEKGFYKLEY